MTIPAQTPPPVATQSKTGPSVVAIVGLAVSFIALVWMVVFFVSQGQFPIAALGSWNLVVPAFFWVAGFITLIMGIIWLIVVSRSIRATAAAR